MVKNLPTNAGVSGDVGSVSGSGRSPGIGNGYDQPRQHIKMQRHCFANKGLSSQSYGFSSIMYKCLSWTVKKAEH